MTRRLRTTLLVIAGVFLGLKLTIGGLAFVTPTGSMEPTLKAFRPYIDTRLGLDEIDRGDIITFKHRQAVYLLPFVNKPVRLSFTKRVIGLPGDTVAIKDGVVFVNGEVYEEDYLLEQGVTTSGQMSEYKVPEGCVFVLGDNRGHSIDSRLYTDEDLKPDPYVPMDDIVSKFIVY